MRAFRWILLAEGVSLLALLFVAMPLKYAAGLPVAVRIVGSLHGLLFLLFVVALYRVAIEHAWPARRVAGAVLASVLPFGTFVLDRRLDGWVDAAPR